MFIIFLLFFSSFLCATETSKSKIIGLIPIRNEEIMIEQCLRGLSMLVDEIIILDDASTDNSVSIIESLAKECKVTEIIQKKNGTGMNPAIEMLFSMQAERMVAHILWSLMRMKCLRPIAWIIIFYVMLFLFCNQATY